MLARQGVGVLLAVMVVDDEEMLHDLYSKLLHIKGHRVVATARNGEEAVEVYQGLDPRPDLVLMDHRMPVMSGLEAMSRILAIDGGARIVFLTADASVAEEALSLGAVDVLLKPFRMDVLHSTLDRADPR